MYAVDKPYTGEIRRLIEGTWAYNPYVEVRGGYYTTLVRKHGGVEVDHTDGVGTKGVLHWRRRAFKTCVQDALGMNINDLLLVGAKAFKTQVHLMVPEDEHGKIVEVMSELCRQCAWRQIAVTGGETSIHNNMDGMELSLTMTGVVVEDWGSRVVSDGDVLLGLRSSGPHSNGFTLLRLVNGVGGIGDWAMEPTRLYDSMLLGRNLPLKGLMHITGGGFRKVLSILPPGHEAHFGPWDVPEWGREMVRNVVSADTAYQTFNMGMGMVLAVGAGDVEFVRGATGAVRLGMVRAVPGVKRVVLDTEFGVVEYE